MPIITKHPNLSLQQIEQWENENTAIPEPYKKFLLKSNGGNAGDKNTFKVPKMSGEFGFNQFFGIHEGLTGLDYIQETYTKMNRFPEHYFAIASDVSGNLILMGQADDNLGQIFFWYHEGEVSEGKKAYEKNIHKIAKDLDAFIQKLYQEEEISYGKLSDIYNGSDEGIRKLLSTDWQVDTPDELGRTLIRRAVVANKKWLVEELIARNASLSKTLDIVVLHNNLEIAELLLKAGADTEEPSMSKNTPLQSAVMGKKRAMVALLLKYGADKNIANSFGRNVLEIAQFKHGQMDVDRSIINMEEIIKLLSE